MVHSESDNLPNTLWYNTLLFLGKFIYLPATEKNTHSSEEQSSLSGMVDVVASATHRVYAR